MHKSSHKHKKHKHHKHDASDDSDSYRNTHSRGSKKQKHRYKSSSDEEGATRKKQHHNSSKKSDKGSVKERLQDKSKEERYHKDYCGSGSEAKSSYRHGSKVKRKRSHHTSGGRDQCGSSEETGGRQPQTPDYEFNWEIHRNTLDRIFFGEEDILQRYFYL